jgi:hypothetical protein
MFRNAQKNESRTLCTTENSRDGLKDSHQYLRVEIACDYFDCMGHLSVNAMTKTEDRLGKQVTMESEGMTLRRRNI